MKCKWCIIMLICPLVIEAATHRLGLQMGIGYDDWFRSSYVARSGGTSPNVGFVYEYKKNHLLFQLGLGVNYKYNEIYNTPITGEFAGMIDTDNDLCTYQYTLFDKKDVMHSVNIAPSVKLGGQWNIFYFLIGVQAYAHMYGEVNTKGYLATTGSYDNFIVPLAAMNNHYFWEKYPLENNVRTRDMDYIGHLLLTGEIGVEIIPFTYKPRSAILTAHRLAFFVDYGFYCLKPPATTPIIDFHLQSDRLDNIDFEQITIQSLFFSDLCPLNKLQPLTIGVRWTLLFELPSSLRCNCL